jgi:hypothetical protein
MKDNLIIHDGDKNRLKETEMFLSEVLNAAPSKSEIKKNEMANNSLYLPISYVETQLDEMFFGAWQTLNFKSQVVANELIGQIELTVFHPVLKIWITRTGTAAVQIQMKSEEKGGDGDITNVQNKIKNTLEKDYPHLKAECIKNAARSLGKAFGRDLNRKFVDTYQPATEQLEFIEQNKPLLDKLKKCNSKTELGMLWETLPDEEQAEIKVKKLFTAKKLQLI